MKKIICVIIVFFILFSCKKKSNPAPVPDTLSTDSTSLHLGSFANLIDSFNINSNIDWTVSVVPATATWLSANLTSGSGGKKLYIHSTSENATAAVRTATVTITPVSSTTAQPVSVTVNQSVFNLVKLWSKAYGGSYGDAFGGMADAGDGYMFGGFTASIDGDFPGQHRTGIFLKIDVNGVKQWFTAYGGSSVSGFHGGMIKSTDGNFIATGYTVSTDGDISGYHGGSSDAWIMKVDPSGNKVWSKVFGGSGHDDFLGVAAIPGGGCVAVGSTESTDVDGIGNHGQADVFVVKMDANGNKIWSKAFGGSQVDAAFGILVNTDGSLIVAGYTRSTDGDVIGNHGGPSDGFLIKMDANGNKLWSKIFGGTGDDYFYGIAGMPDGSIILAGNTTSNDGDITGYHAGGSKDGWCIKLDNNGNKIWSNAYGGTKNEILRTIAGFPGGGFIICGDTDSNDGDVSGNNGNSDLWLLGINNDGSKGWSRVFGGPGGDSGVQAMMISPNSFVAMGYAGSSNIPGYHGDVDHWVMKFNFQ